MQLSPRAKSAASAVKYCLFFALIAGCAIYGVGTGEAPAPTRHHNFISRAIHPFWFWTTEWFYLICAAVAAWAAIGELRKGRRTVAGSAKVRREPQIPAAAPSGPAARAAATAGSPPQKSAAAQPPKPAARVVPGAEVRSASPNGRYIVRVYPQEMRMSHWVETPELFDTATQQVLFRPVDSAWSLGAVTWQSESVVAMTLRRYPGAHTPIEATFDCAGGSAKIAGITVERFAGSPRVENALEQAYELGKVNYRPVRHGS